MNEGTEEQINQWLKKLERESWQLELLVSAFTIFLLVAASENFTKVINIFFYKYADPTGSIITFLSLTLLSIWVLTGFLIFHLLLRGFWIGTIGLRSVNPSINLDALNYSDFFKKKFEKKLIGLDRLVVQLDEISSVIFSISFLIIFMLISLGMYLVFVGVFAVTINSIFNIILEFRGQSPNSLIIWVRFLIITIILPTGMIFMIDFFTLGFFKKFGVISKIYYPIYRFYSIITLSFISRSIYYNLISKYSKKRIRIFLSLFLLLLLYLFFIRFDQYQFFPITEDKLVLENNFYDDKRSESDYVKKVSVESKFSTEPYISLFIRYNLNDNSKINSNCPELVPMKNNGINFRFKFVFENGILLRPQNFEDEDKEMLLHCLSELYEVSINDSVCHDLNYYFARHPTHEQKGILTTLPTCDFKTGENIIEIKKKYINSSDSLIKQDFARVPIWFSREE